MAIDGRDSSTDVLPQQGDLTVVPAMFEHAVRVYNQMHDEGQPDLDLSGLFVYEGHLTNLFKKLLLSVPYYTEIKNHLVAMGCIEQVRRGGGNGTSRWVLWKEPTLEEWKGTKPTRAKRGNAQTMTAQQVKDLTERMRVLEAKIDYMQEVLDRLESQ